MDALSEALNSVRAGQVAVRRLRQQVSWGMAFAPFSGTGLHVVLAGSCWLATETQPPRELLAGTVVVLAHGARHGLSHAPVPLRTLPEFTSPLREGAAPVATAGLVSDVLCGAYRLPRGLVHPALRQLPDAITISTAEGRHPALGAVIDLVRVGVGENQSGGDVARSALLDLLLVQSFRAWAQQVEGRWPEVDDPHIASVLRTIYEFPQKPWTVNTLSAIAGLSRGTFSRRFTAVVGAPPMAYLTIRRLEVAGRYLRETEQPLAAIASIVGYGSEYAFANAFRRQFGLAPGQFRHRSADRHAAAQLATADPRSL